MKLRTLAALAFLVMLAGYFAPKASADPINDPAMFQDGINCVGWCHSAGIGVDPNTSDATLEFITTGITFTTGWVSVQGSGGQDLLDFVDNNGTYEIFLYCGSTDCESDDAGLPTTLPTVSAANTYNATGGVIAGYSFTPAVGDAGYDSNSTYSTYGIEDDSNATKVNGVGVTDTEVPEPSSLLLLGSALVLSLAVLRRRIVLS